MQTLDFTWGDISGGAVKITSTDDAANLLIENLVEDLTFEASAPCLGLSADALTNGDLKDTLSILIIPVSAAADQLLAALGVGLGEGGFRVNGAKCDYAILTQ